MLRGYQKPTNTDLDGLNMLTLIMHFTTGYAENLHKVLMQLTIWTRSTGASIGLMLELSWYQTVRCV